MAQACASIYKVIASKQILAVRQQVLYRRDK
jgi:hypothetical protein